MRGSIKAPIGVDDGRNCVGLISRPGRGVGTEAAACSAEARKRGAVRERCRVAVVRERAGSVFGRPIHPDASVPGLRCRSQGRGGRWSAAIGQCSAIESSGGLQHDWLHPISCPGHLNTTPRHRQLCSRPSIPTKLPPKHAYLPSCRYSAGPVSQSRGRRRRCSHHSRHPAAAATLI